ncbi:unnamed protein product [Penicillium bialowiezense]
MTSTHPNLGSFPVEVLSTIFGMLDPIGLISASQTNSRFRAVINPQRIHFVERLLQVECGPEGGGTPIFRAKDNDLRPNPASDEWENIRWACSNCLKLLPHEAFSNQHLLRLKFRKPLGGSPAATPLTSWEPSKRRGFALTQKKSKARKVAERKDRRARCRYNLAVKNNWQPPRDENRLRAYQGSGMIAFRDVNLEEYLNVMSMEEERARLDQEAFRVELVRCGFQRHQRKCNECRFQLHEISPHVGRPDEGYEQGTLKIPIVTSRQYPYESALERFFPGVDEALKIERPLDEIPSRWDEQVNRLWTTYNIRCPSCELWQEMRDFRLGGLFNKWAPKMRAGSNLRNWDGNILTPESMDNLRCNYCYAIENGREKLCAILVHWLNCLLDQEQARLGPNDITISRLLYDEWVEVWANLTQDLRHLVNPNVIDKTWFMHYGDIEAQLKWVVQCQTELVRNGDAVVEWALE